MHQQEHSRGSRHCGDAAKPLPLLVLILGLVAIPVLGDPARARDAHYSKAFKGVKADGLKDQRLWKFQDFALPLSRYFKGVNGSVDLALVTYRIYGPDVTYPPSKELVKAAETVMQGMYEGFCNISAFVVSANVTPSPPSIRNPAVRTLDAGSLVPIGNEPIINFNISAYRSVDLTFFSRIFSNSSFPEITGTAQAGFLDMRGDAMKNLNFKVSWLMDIRHEAQATGIPVISLLPLTPTETHWMTILMDGPMLSPFGVEKQTALLAALGRRLLVRTNVFRLTVEQVEYFDTVPGYLDSINVTMLVSKYDSAFLPPLTEVLSEKGEGIMAPKAGNRTVFIDDMNTQGLDVRRSKLLSINPYYGPPLTWPDAVHQYKQKVAKETAIFRFQVIVISLMIGLAFAAIAYKYNKNFSAWLRKLLGIQQVYTGPLNTTNSGRALMNVESLKRMFSGASDASRASNIPEPLWNGAEIKPDDVAIALHSNMQPWVLGAGSFGRVYKGLLYGVHEVAIKVFDVDVADFDLTQSALSMEIAILRSCTNPHIVQFQGVSFKNHEVWMVMEYMDGGNLFNALKTGREQVRWKNGGRKIALDIARGLAWLHSHDVIHLDIKSPNILLSTDGSAKLGDVGLSHRLQNGRTHATLVDVGTYDWCAPEIILYQQATVKSDIFSYGVVMWEIITGKPPSRGRITDVTVPDDCCQETADLLYRCLSEVPTSRPTAAEVIIALSDIMGLPHPMSSTQDPHYTPDLVIDVSTSAVPITNNGDLSFTWRYQNSVPNHNPFAAMANGGGSTYSIDKSIMSPSQASGISGNGSILQGRGASHITSSSFGSGISKALSARPSDGASNGALAALRSALPQRNSVPEAAKKAS